MQCAFGESYWNIEVVKNKNRLKLEHLSFPKNYTWGYRLKYVKWCWDIHKLLVDHLLMLYIPCLLRCVKWFRKYFQSTSKTFGKYFWPVLWLYGVWLGCSLKCVKWFRKWGRKQIDRKRRRGFDQRSTDSYYFLMFKHYEIYIVNSLTLLTFLLSNCTYLLSIVIVCLKCAFNSSKTPCE